MSRGSVLVKKVHTPFLLFFNTLTMTTPPSITTTNILLRGLLPSFLGCSLEHSGCGAFQMTWRKDLETLGADNGA